MEILNKSLGARKLTLLELQVLVRHLNFACRVIAPGRAFLCRFCDSMTGALRPHHKVRVSAEMREDMRTWQQFLEDFNGVSFWREEKLFEAELQVHLNGPAGRWMRVRLGQARNLA